MARGIDLSAATRMERAVFATGLVLFLNAFLPWWYRVRTPRQTFFHNGGLFGWGLLAALAGFTAAAVVVVRHARLPAAFNDRSIYLILGGAATLSLGIHAVQAEALWFGFWFECVVAVALIAAGFARARERRKGWV